MVRAVLTSDISLLLQHVRKLARWRRRSLRFQHPESHVPLRPNGHQERVDTDVRNCSGRLSWRHRARPSTTLHEIQARSQGANLNCSHVIPRSPAGMQAKPRNPAAFLRWGHPGRAGAVAAIFRVCWASPGYARSHLSRRRCLAYSQIVPLCTRAKSRSLLHSARAGCYLTLLRTDTGPRQPGHRLLQSRLS